MAIEPWESIQQSFSSTVTTVSNSSKQQHKMYCFTTERSWSKSDLVHEHREILW